MVTILTGNNLVYQRQTKYYTALEKWNKCRVPAYSKPLKIVYDSKPSLAKQAHERIIGLILNGEFSAGCLLHERKLAEFLKDFPYACARYPNVVDGWRSGGRTQGCPLTVW